MARHRPGRRCRSPLITAVAVLLAFAAPAAAEDARIAGWLLLRAGYGLNAGNRDAVLSEQLLQLEWERTDMAGWRVDAKAWAQRESRLEPDVFEQVELRELTATKDTADASLTLGRQIAVWGKADGFRLLDIVNPLDLREFVLGDDVRSRLPLWMVNAQLFGAEQRQLQLVLVPQTYHDRVPPPGSQFDFSAALPPGTTLLPLEEASNRPANWSYGARWSRPAGDWDWSAVAWRGLGGAPVLFPTVRASGEVALRQAIVKRTVLGGAADWNAGPAVLRGELAVSPREYRMETTSQGLPAVVQATAVRSLIGVDWTVSGWLVSPQLFNVHAKGSPATANDPDGTYASLVIDQKFLHDRLAFRFFHARSLQRSDWWTSAKLTYQVNGHLDVLGGIDVLGGERSGLFGQFANRDRVVAGIQAYF